MWNKIDILKFLWWTIPILVSFYSLYQSNEAIKYSKDQAEASKKQVTISESQLTEEKNKLKVETINNIRDNLTSTTIFPEVSNSFFNYYDSSFTKNDFITFSRKLEMITTAYDWNIINEEDIKENFYSEIDFICRNFTIATSSSYNKKIQILCNIIN